MFQFLKSSFHKYSTLLITTIHNWYVDRKELILYKRNKPPTPRHLSLVKYTGPDGIKNINTTEHYIFLGEIPNMPSHCVIMEFERKSKVHVGYHTDDFIELTDEET